MKTIIVVCCLLDALRTVEADITAEGVERGDVLFRCSHKNARTNNKYLCKKPCGSKDDILLSVTPGGRSGSERITLMDLGNGDLNVIFHGLRLTDSGTYWCGVERMGFDTHIIVHLTVKEGVANETTTDTPSPSTLKANDNASTSIATAPNSTDGGEQSDRSGTVLLIIPVAVVALTILVLAAWLGKRRKSWKPQSRVFTNSSTAPVRANNREVDCERDNISDEMPRMVTFPDNLTCTREPARDPPTAAVTAGESSSPFHIYENICCSRDAAHTTTKCRKEDDTCSGIDIGPSSSTRPEHAGGGHLEKKAKSKMSTRNVTKKPSEKCVSEVSGCDSTETRPRSLWFGLDLSGTV